MGATAFLEHFVEGLILIIYLVIMRSKMITRAFGSALAIPQIGATQEVLDEITVTASKRSENLRDVPISIPALSSTSIEELGISDFDNYAQMLPTAGAADHCFP